MIAPPVRLAPQQRRTLVWPVVGLIVLGICGLVTVGLAGSEIGAVGVVIGVVLALVPVAPVVAAFLWIDRFEPEPPRLLLAAFLWGAGLSALVAVVINSSAILAAELLLGQGQGDVVGAIISAPLVEEFVKGAFVVGLLLAAFLWGAGLSALVAVVINSSAILAAELLLGQGQGDVVGAIISAPLVEEFVKGAFVVGLLLVRRREFDGIVDGVVYAGMTAAGFAFTENIIYFGRAFTEAAGAPGAAVLATFVLRGVLSPFAHPLFTALTGIGVGIASQVRSRFVGTLAVLGGYVLAVVLHALWNSSTQLGAGFFGIYVLIMLPLFAGMIGLVVWQRRRETDVLARQMPGFAAAGWIAPSEVSLLSSLAGRRRWRTAVHRRAGATAARAVEDYQHAVTELAFLRARAERGALPPRSDWHAELLDAVVRTRLAAVNAPGVEGPAGPSGGRGGSPPTWPGTPPRPPVP